MPELPEVETSRRGILPYLEHQVLKSVVVRNEKLRWPVSPEIRNLKDVTLKSIGRRGKYILIELEEGVILVHLGMSGSLRIVPDNLEPKKHDHVDFVLSNNKRMRYNDPRRFGSILWTDDLASHPLIAHLGIEPLEGELTGRFLADAAKNKKLAIKQFIMDSHVVVGVGNIYANEALFLAGIHPKRSVSRISIKRFDILAEKIKLVLTNSIKEGGTSLKDFVGSDGKPGYFKQALNVYGRGGEPCKCCGAQLKEIRMGQRSTVYCGKCQK